MEIIVTNLTGRYRIDFRDNTRKYFESRVAYIKWLADAYLWMTLAIYREYQIDGTQTKRWEQIR